MCFLSGCNHPSFAFQWRTLLAHLVALHLLHLGSAQLTVVAPNHRVTAIVGQDVVLRCHLSACKDARSSDIRWIQHRSSGFVHHYQNGEDLEQMEEYKGRTELLRDGLPDGNLDLCITAVSSSDSGSYSCAVQDGDGYAEAVVNLEVSDPFSEIVHPWKVALAVVITLLLGSFVIIAFLHRKQAARIRELKRKYAELERSDAKLEKLAGKLEQQTEAVERSDAKLETLAENLKKLAGKLEQQTEAVEKGNSQWSKPQSLNPRESEVIPKDYGRHEKSLHTSFSTPTNPEKRHKAMERSHLKHPQYPNCRGYQNCDN
uniref:BG-like antigen 1 n=1 Tax=Meleagris gallopavo TaxID=9103 RepID=B1N1C5_MELGA|nr:BG-like antigen 1 [Meleagris gallopavo]